MKFHLQERSPEWIDTAPIRIVRDIEVCASAPAVFATLADHVAWSGWFKKMRRVRIDGEASGVGALRTVWVGGARVQERFVRWEENRHLTFNIVSSNLPGMLAMTEDWVLTDGAANHATLHITIAVEPIRALRPLAPLLRSIVANSTAGASGIAHRFPCEEH